MARTLITGGTGFIGSHLARDCLRRGDEVTILARPDSDVWRLDGSLDRVALHRQDPMDAKALRELLARSRPQRVFLLAAATQIRRSDGLRDMDFALRANVEPLRLILDELAAMAETPSSVVRTGSLAEIGTAAEEPADIYGLSILMGTHLQRIWRDWTGIPAVSARLCLTYGGDQTTSFFIPGAVAEALSGTVAPPRRPDALRDLLHIDDVVTALQLISDNAAKLPATVNVSTGTPYRLGEVAAMIADIAGQSIATADPGESTDVVSSRPTPELLELGWSPRIPLREGLTQMFDWESDRIMAKTARCAQ